MADLRRLQNNVIIAILSITVVGKVTDLSGRMAGLFINRDNI